MNSRTLLIVAIGGLAAPATSYADWSCPDANHCNVPGTETDPAQYQSRARKVLPFCSPEVSQSITPIVPIEDEDTGIDGLAWSAEFSVGRYDRVFIRTSCADRASVGVSLCRKVPVSVYSTANGLPCDLDAADTSDCGWHPTGEIKWDCARDLKSERFGRGSPNWSPPGKPSPSGAAHTECLEAERYNAHCDTEWQFVASDDSNFTWSFPVERLIPATYKLRFFNWSQTAYQVHAHIVVVRADEKDCRMAMEFGAPQTAGWQPLEGCFGALGPSCRKAEACAEESSVSGRYRMQRAPGSNEHDSCCTQSHAFWTGFSGHMCYGRDGFNNLDSGKPNVFARSTLDGDEICGSEWDHAVRDVFSQYGHWSWLSPAYIYLPGYSSVYFHESGDIWYQPLPDAQRFGGGDKISRSSANQGWCEGSHTFNADNSDAICQ